MRLWHLELLAYLPTMQLAGQHRECAALRGNGWGKNHSTVNYIWKYRYEVLVKYHLMVMTELKTRRTKTGKLYQIDTKWLSFAYRGKYRPPLPKWARPTKKQIKAANLSYKEHDEDYLKACIINLLNKIQKAPEGKYPQEEIDRLKDFAKSKNLL